MSDRIWLLPQAAELGIVDLEARYAEVARERLANVVAAPTLFDQPSIDQDALELIYP